MYFYSFFNITILNDQLAEIGLRLKIHRHKKRQLLMALISLSRHPKPSPISSTLLPLSIKRTKTLIKLISKQLNEEISNLEASSKKFSELKELIYEALLVYKVIFFRDQNISTEEHINFSKNLGIYENPEQLLSISLGSAETTLLKLTSAYSVFVNGGKLVDPIIIDRIQDSEGKTILSDKKRKCVNCDQISYLSNDYPKIENNYKQIFSPQTAFQMTSILEGVVQRGTGKGLRDLNLDLAGKTGTTNKNTDTWFIGFTSKLLVGVYVGHDNPKSLGKRETGAKTAMPIFKNFIKNSTKKKDARPFKVANDVVMMVVDSETGEKASFGTKKTIIEVFKKKDINKEDLIKSKINNRLKNNNVLRFY